MPRSFSDFNATPPPPPTFNPFIYDDPDIYPSPPSTQSTQLEDSDGAPLPIPSLPVRTLPPPRSPSTPTPTPTSTNIKRKEEKKGMAAGLYRVMNVGMLIGSMLMSSVIINQLSPEIETTRLQLEKDSKQIGASNYLKMLNERPSANPSNPLEIQYDRAYVVDVSYNEVFRKVKVILYSNDLSIVQYAELFGTLKPGFVYADVRVKGNQLLFAKLTHFQPPPSLLP